MISRLNEIIKKYNLHYIYLLIFVIFLGIHILVPNIPLPFLGMDITGWWLIWIVLFQIYEM